MSFHNNRILSSWKYWRWLIVLILLIAIFCFSNLPSEKVYQILRPIKYILWKISDSVNIIFHSNIDYLKAGHIIGYALLGLAFYFAISRKLGSGKSCLISFVCSSLYAFTDEYHQQFISGRSPLLTDVLIDSLAAGIVLLIVWLLGRGIKKLLHKIN
jgi:VanZ family protein